MSLCRVTTLFYSSFIIWWTTNVYDSFMMNSLLTCALAYSSAIMCTCIFISDHVHLHIHQRSCALAYSSAIMCTCIFISDHVHLHIHQRSCTLAYSSAIMCTCIFISDHVHMQIHRRLCVGIFLIHYFVLFATQSLFKLKCLLQWNLKDKLDWCIWWNIWNIYKDKLDWCIGGTSEIFMLPTINFLYEKRIIKNVTIRTLISSKIFLLQNPNHLKFTHIANRYTHSILPKVYETYK